MLTLSIRTLIALSLLLAPVMARADQPVLVELFTSQGCSSCPPADRLLGEISDEAEVVALAFHVDYWDYLGWKDKFASRANTLRQSAYVGNTDRSRISQRLRGKFTPEIVVQGQDSLVGHDRLTIAARVRAWAEAPVQVQLEIRGGEVIVSPVVPRLPEAEIFLATFSDSETVEVARGENAGRRLTYHHVVTGLTRLAKWSGKREERFAIEAAGPFAIFVQAGKGGPILAALLAE